MHPAHLIVNPGARAVTPAVTRAVRAALASRFHLDVTKTDAHGGGIPAGRAAIEAGAELIIVFGGDGLVNEVVNGMAGSPAVLGIIPGGTMNVLARNLGLPRDPLEAVDRVIDWAGEASAGRAAARRIPLGGANGRLFTFACGCGFDAAAAARVDSHTRAKHRLGEPYFYAAALATFLGSYGTRRPFLRCEGSFGAREGVMAVAMNFSPYAYLAGRRVRLGSPGPADGKLDVFVLRRFQFWRVPTYALGAFLTGQFGPEATSIRGLEEILVTSEEAIDVHVDGEPLPPAHEVHITGMRSTLRVIA